MTSRFGNTCELALVLAPRLGVDSFVEAVFERCTPQCLPELRIGAPNFLVLTRQVRKTFVRLRWCWRFALERIHLLKLCLRLFRREDAVFHRGRRKPDGGHSSPDSKSPGGLCAMSALGRALLRAVRVLEHSRFSTNLPPR
mmetsp:Transcript_40549/g.91289  ORF Transcript_40549/g.91289 Transcript_40549/m.91289 type:complete len:141 (+) Transcript_40549:1867-2289(+)